MYSFKVTLLFIYRILWGKPVVGAEFYFAPRVAWFHLTYCSSGGSGVELDIKWSY